MKPPLFCLAAALLFWGWLTGFLIQALLMVLVLVLARPSGLRLRIRHKDLNRIADLCVLCVTGAIVYLFFTPLDNDTRLPLLVMQWSPMLLFPLAAVQAGAETDQFALFALVPVLGTRRCEQYDAGITKAARANLLFPYLGLVLLAAGCANQRYDWYYPVLFGLVAWALSAGRPKRGSVLRWLGVLLLCGLAGYFGQDYLDQLQARLRGWARGSDPYHRETAIGSMGELKLSDDILMRVRTEPGQGRPPLLREASYNFYRGRVWDAAAGFFGVVQAANKEKSDWELHPELGTDSLVTIYRFFPRTLGMVPAPGGTTRISALPARELLQNNLGAIKAERADGLCAYQAGYLRDAVLEGPPTPVDLVVLPKLRAVLETTAQAAGLDASAPERAPERLLQYIWKNFSYSLQLTRGTENADPLSDFLLNTRRGHCEYFATAAAMLLRQVGIPTRYVVGYALLEYDPASGMYLVRERHRHAWAIYYLGEAWHVLDATPPNWGELEYRRPGLWQRVADFRAQAIFMLARWRWLEKDGKVKTVLVLVALGIGLVLLVRIFRQQGRRVFRRVGRGPRTPDGREGRELPFARVEARLRKRGLVRPDWQPLEQWLRANRLAGLLPVLRLHYKQRFDPDSFSEADRRKLEQLVETWLRN